MSLTTGPTPFTRTTTTPTTGDDRPTVRPDAPGYDAGHDPAGDTLRRVAAMFTLAYLAHNIDHARRGIFSLPPAVFAGGLAGMLLVMVTLTLIARRDVLAPKFAVVAGIVTTSGVVVAHLLPHFGPLSDTFHGRADAITWVSGLLDASLAVAMGIAGLRALRSHRPA